LPFSPSCAVIARKSGSDPVGIHLDRYQDRRWVLMKHIAASLDEKQHLVPALVPEIMSLLVLAKSTDFD